KKVIQIGIRGSTSGDDYHQFSHDSGMRVVYVEEFFEIGDDAVIAESRRVVSDCPTYVSLDVDGLDPVYAPGKGTPEVGGYTTHDAQRMLRGLSGCNLVGGDVVEIFPPLDPSGNTALVNASLMFEIMCLLAGARVARA
ncbi:MAG: arginase family protein, partial [Pseudomonadota bacterium]|nr:arginase family protein [Pseudomonadota bacterium]